MAEDVKDVIRAVSKSAQRTFGPQLGQVWELDRSEVNLLAGPSTRLIKQVSNGSVAMTPGKTAMLLGGIAALLVLPRMFITASYLKAVKVQQAAQQHQETAQQARAQTTHGFDPLRNIMPQDD